jgi:hypothetical protein
MSRLFGWRQDVFDHRDWLTGDKMDGGETRLGAAPRVGDLLTGKPSLLHLRGPRIEQHGQSCVGFTLKRALYISHRLQGIQNPVMASGLANYTIARRQEHRLVRPLPALIDRGCRPRDAMNGVQAVGFVPETVWTDTPDHVQAQLTPKVTSAAYDQKGERLQWMRADASGWARVDAVREGTLKGWVAMFAILVDQPYADHVGSDAISSINPKNILGGHYQGVLAVEDDGTVLADNWWGPNWGFNDGMCRIHPALFGSGYVSDVILLKSAPAWA